MYGALLHLPVQVGESLIVIVIIIILYFYPQAMSFYILDLQYLSTEPALLRHVFQTDTCY